MNKFAWLPAIILPVMLTACGTNDDFDGRFVAPDGLTSYEFLPEGELDIEKGGEDLATAQYRYDSGDQTITVDGETDLPANELTVTDDGNLQAGDTKLIRGIDYGMLVDSTWIGEQGEFVFALTFTEAEDGLATTSELVTYFEDEKAYLSQIDDSVTRLSGNAMFVDLTQYTVSEVSENSFKVSIGGNSMTLEKQPKDTKIEYREGYQSVDEES